MRALIVDDERVAREELKRLLAAHPDVKIVGEARDGEEAVKEIRRLEPDLVFLDIQMPVCDGFEVLARLDEAPAVIFTTAYDEYALRAFEVNALDYLLKPVDPARLRTALERLAAPPPKPDHVFIREGDRCWLVRWADIVLMESEGNYTRLHFGANRPLIPRSLATLEPRLNPAVFFRADRKYILNVGFITEVQFEAEGNLRVTLKTGQRVSMSRRQSAKLRELMSL